MLVYQRVALRCFKFINPMIGWHRRFRRWACIGSHFFVRLMNQTTVLLMRVCLKVWDRALQVQIQWGKTKTWLTNIKHIKNGSNSLIPCFFHKPTFWVFFTYENWRCSEILNLDLLIWCWQTNQAKWCFFTRKNMLSSIIFLEYCNLFYDVFTSISTNSEPKFIFWVDRSSAAKSVARSRRRQHRVGPVSGQDMWVSSQNVELMMFGWWS